MNKWYRINEITEWEEDTALIAGDASHEGYRAVQRLLEEERVKKIDDGYAKSLPFVVEADNEEEALEKYVEQCYKYEYLKPVKAESEEVHQFEVSRQVDCRDYVVVFAKDFDEARDKAGNISVDMDELEIIETHVVNATDVVTNELTDLC